MSNLNNLSKQHLSERPVMEDEDRWKEDESCDRESGGQKEKRNMDNKHTHKRT